MKRESEFMTLLFSNRRALQYVCIAAIFVISVAFTMPAKAGTVACAKLLWLQRLAPQDGHGMLQLPYREERHSALLAQPQKSSGTLEYDMNSGAMTKRVVTPEAASLGVKGRQLTMQRGKRVRRVKLAKDSDLLWTLNALAALASGSFESLQGNYVTTCSRSNDAWALRLTPAELDSSGALRSLDIEGLERQLQRVTSTMKNGDTTTMFFNPE